MQYTCIERGCSRYDLSCAVLLFDLLLLSFMRGILPFSPCFSCYFFGLNGKLLESLLILSIPLSLSLSLFSSFFLLPLSLIHYYRHFPRSAHIACSMFKLHASYSLYTVILKLQNFRLSKSHMRRIRNNCKQRAQSDTSDSTAEPIALGTENGRLAQTPTVKAAATTGTPNRNHANRNKNSNDWKHGPRPTIRSKDEMHKWRAYIC